MITHRMFCLRRAGLHELPGDLKLISDSRNASTARGIIYDTLNGKFLRKELGRNNMLFLKVGTGKGASHWPT